MITYAVISHTHWDREWYEPLEIFRLRLVDLIDHCLATLHTYPEYIFHLDAQTIVLEDYLTFRPDREAELRKFITDGRLIVGPWYVQNDFFLTSGESTVRNLLTGIRIASRFGRCARVGYAPDQFGHISQLPQILDGFRLDSFIFGRGFFQTETDENGVLHRALTPTEFIWKGADGTEKLAIHMCYWYNNAQRFSENIDCAMVYIEAADRGFRNRAATPYYLLMNGVDHLEAQDDLLPILDKMNARLPEDKRILQYELADYVDAVKAYIREKHIALQTVEGDLRQGDDFSILKGCLSSRSYLKHQNDLAQNMLECRLEPLYSMLELAGARDAYPTDLFRYMWKSLLQNHAHDSICGCSRDEVHRHMEDNFARLSTTMHEMWRRGQLLMAQHMDLPEFKDENYVITVTNTVETERGGLVDVTLDFPAAEHVTCFDILDSNGTPALFEVLSHEKAYLDLITPVNLPGIMDVDRYTIRLDVPAVAAMAVKGYIVKPHSREQAACTPCTDPASVSKPVMMENEALRVIINGGRISIQDKKSGFAAENAIRIEDSADKGDAYIYWPEENQQVIYADAHAEVKVLVWSEKLKRVAVHYDLAVPRYYDFQAMRRSDETVSCPVILTFTLASHEEFVNIEYSVENHAKDHRIRLLVHTGLRSRVSFADSAFDIRQYDDSSHFAATKSRVLPNATFAALEAAGSGVAVFTIGEHEYEHLADDTVLAFTLVRATGFISQNYSTFHFSSGYHWKVPENQCLRTVSGRIGISLYAGSLISAGIPIRAKAFRNPLAGFFTSCDRKKFSGGRTAVQDTRLEEIFYLPDPYEIVKIPDGESFVRATGEGLLLTAVKKAENGVDTVLRYVNLSEKTVESTLSVKGMIYQTNLEEVGLTCLGRNEVNVVFGPKKILTFLIKNQ